MFYLICNSGEQRSDLIAHLKRNGVLAVSHYLSLHSSPYYRKNHDGRNLINSDSYTQKLLRLPMFYELNIKTVLNTLLSYEG
jgi:dTDP-4-amino-4,6-dideoxygalactose transaminase